MDHIHPIRSRALIRQHPQIRSLVGPDRTTMFYVIGVTAAQLALAIVSRGWGWLPTLALAYCVGAFLSHAIFVLIHEAAHNLMAKRSSTNFWMGIICDWVNVIPTSVMFRTYHLKHHVYMGEYDVDADLPSQFERDLIGNSSFKKAIWLLFFPLMQTLRPLRLKGIEVNYKWFALNALSCFAMSTLLYVSYGAHPLVYLLLSMLFGLGLHPLGARWIQEHFTADRKQETFSYYGPLNKLCFNVGFHNEHHDFPSISWRKLPKLYEIGRKEYDALESHASWSKLLARFILSPEFSPASRIERSRPEMTRASSEAAMLSIEPLTPS